MTGCVSSRFFSMVQPVKACFQTGCTILKNEEVSIANLPSLLCSAPAAAEQDVRALRANPGGSGAAGESLLSNRLHHTKKRGGEHCEPPVIALQCPRGSGTGCAIAVSKSCSAPAAAEQDVRALRANPGGIKISHTPDSTPGTFRTFR